MKGKGTVCECLVSVYVSVLCFLSFCVIDVGLPVLA